MKLIRPNLAALIGIFIGAYIGGFLGSFEGTAFVLGFAFTTVFTINLIAYTVTKQLKKRERRN